MVDEDREIFTMLVIAGSNTCRHSFRIEVGKGSETQDFVGEDLISFSISDGVT